MSEPRQPKTRHKTTTWTEYNAALKARGSLTIWLDKGMQWYGTRQPVASGVASRRSRMRPFSFAWTSSVCLAWHYPKAWDWHVPDFSTLSRRQRTLQVQLPYRRSRKVLDLLVYSTGIKFLGEGECKRKKHGIEYRRQWRKVHLGIDAHTLEIRAIEG